MRVEVPDLPQQNSVNRSASILDSDPSDYSVALDDTIVLQASESVGQLADWLEIPTWDIRELNNISFRDQAVIGTKVADLGQGLKDQILRIDDENSNSFKLTARFL